MDGKTDDKTYRQREVLTLLKERYFFETSMLEPFFRDDAKMRIEPFHIIGNVYYVGNYNVSSHIIDTGEGLILIDTTFPQTRALLIQSIWEMGFNPKDIKYIIHTHGHIDHIGGTNLLKLLSGAKTVLHKADAEMFDERPELSFDGDNPLPYNSLFHPDILIEDGDTLTLGNTCIHFVHTPGHCFGVVSLFFETEDNGKKYLCGMQGGAGLNTVSQEFFDRYGEKYGLDRDATREQYRNSMKKIMDIPVDITLGNHPDMNNTFEKRAKMLENPAENPFIDPTEWKRYLQSVLDNFEEMVSNNK